MYYREIFSYIKCLGCFKISCKCVVCKVFFRLVLIVNQHDLMNWIRINGHPVRIYFGTTLQRYFKLQLINFKLFFESEFFGVGSQWRAAGWMAALVAALESSRPLAQWRVSYDVPGLIDGPSAGMLMTVGTLAAMLGQPLLPGVSMTGTINPDGSVGPVSGIYHKLAGAQEKGLRKILIPAGQRREEQKDGTVKDLVARGNELGIEVREIADLEEAYRELTGQALHQAPDDGRVFQVPPKAQQALEQSYARWEGKLSDALNRMRQTASQVPPQFHPALDAAWKNAQAVRAKAMRAASRATFCAAMPLMFVAAVGADSATILATSTWPSSRAATRAC